MLGTEILYQFLILIGVATAVATLFFYLRVPTIIGFILAGTLVGPYGLKIVASVPGAKQLSEIGIIFLMFSIGLEFSLRRLKNLKRAFLGLGAGQFILTSLFVAVSGYLLFSLPTSRSLFIGFLVSMSSTAIVMKLMQDARDIETPYGNASVGILIFQDLAFIPVVLLLPLLSHSDVSFVAGGTIGDHFFSGGLGTVLKFLGLVGGLIILAKFVFPFIFEKIVNTRSKELFFFAVILLCFGIAFLMGKVGGSYSLGAFAAGVLIAESDYAKQAISDVLPLRDNFLGLFFTSIGMLIDLNFFITHIHWILILSIIVFFVKSGVIYGIARVFKYPITMAAVIALILSQVGEFSFVLAEVGRSFKLIEETELQYFFAVSVLSMMATPFLYKFAPKFAFDVFMKTVDRLPFRDHIKDHLRIPSEPPPLPAECHVDSEHIKKICHTIIIGFGVAGHKLAKALRNLGIPYAIIEMNYETVSSAKKFGEPIFFGDASKEEILLTAGILTARLVVIATSGSKITPQVLKAVRELRPDVDVIVRAQYLREFETLKADERADIVVAEFETTLEILARSLSIYGASSQKIQEFLSSARKNLGRGSKDFEMSASLRRRLELPSWEALASIRPFKIEEGFVANGKSLAELNLRRLSGASIVSVFREFSGTTIPGPDFVLLKNDIVNIIGSSEAMKAAEEILRGKSIS